MSKRCVELSEAVERATKRHGCEATDSTAAAVDAMREANEEMQALLGRHGLKATLFNHQFLAARAVAGLSELWPLSLERQAELLKSAPRRPDPVGGMLLADAMGLGKTVELLSGLVALCCLRHGRHKERVEESCRAGCIVVCPPTLLRQWEREVRRHTHLSVALYHGSTRHTSSGSFTQLAGADVVLTTYDVITAEVKRVVAGRTSPMFPRVTSDVASAFIGRKKRASAGVTEEEVVLRLVEDFRAKLAGWRVWQAVFFDEAHRLRNPKAIATRSALLLGRISCRVICSTGTPFNNKLDDVASLCRLVGDAPYDSSCWWREATEAMVKAWRARYLVMRGKSALNPPLPPLKARLLITNLTCVVQVEEMYVTLSERELKVYAKGLHVLRGALESFMKNQDIQNAEGSLVDDVMASSTTRHTGKRLVPTAERASKGHASETGRRLLAALLRLRQATDHPLLHLGREHSLSLLPSSSPTSKKQPPVKCCICEGVSDDDPVGNKSEAADEAVGGRVAAPPVLTAKPCGHSVCSETCAKAYDATGCPRCLIGTDVSGNQIAVPPWSSAKASCIVDLLDTWKGDKVIVFSTWTSYLDILESALHARGLPYFRYDGEMTNAVRDDQLLQFAAARVTDQRAITLLASLKAGGLGLNLAFANRVVFCERWFNPFVEDQAIDRVHRIGQKRPVTVTYLVAENTVDTVIADTQRKKRDMASEVLQGVRRFIPDAESSESSRQSTILTTMEASSLVVDLLALAPNRNEEVEVNVNGVGSVPDDVSSCSDDDHDPSGLQQITQRLIGQLESIQLPAHNSAALAAAAQRRARDSVDLTRIATLLWALLRGQPDLAQALVQGTGPSAESLLEMACKSPHKERPANGVNGSGGGGGGGGVEVVEVAEPSVMEVDETAANDEDGDDDCTAGLETTTAALQASGLSEGVAHTLGTAVHKRETEADQRQALLSFLAASIKKFPRLLKGVETGMVEADWLMDLSLSPGEVATWFG